MKYKRLKLCLMLLLVITGLHAQEIHQAIATSGGEASGIGGTASYSIGQIVYTTNTGSNGSASQGVQQPFEISELTGILTAKDITLSCTAFPNPSTNYVILRVENISLDNFSYQLLDINGKLLENKKITDNETSITINTFTSTNYFLKVINNNVEVKTFKIIKN